MHKIEFDIFVFGLRADIALAGYIAPMFRDAPSNCILPEEWRQWLT